MNSSDNSDDIAGHGVDAGPVFIVGMYGSGTSMLLESLGRHPDLFGYKRETKLLPNFMASLQKYGDLNDDRNFSRLWEDVRSIETFRTGKFTEVVPIPENWRELPRNLGAVFDSIMKYLASKENKQRWCEKTPLHVLYMRDILKYFPDAKFIHIIRDGRDCAASLLRRWHRTPELTIFRWKRVVSEGQRQGRLLGERYFEVRYEDLTTNPEIWMRRICSFLCIKYNDVVLESSQPWKDSKIYKSVSDSKHSPVVGRISANSEKWKKYFNSSQVRSIELIAGSTLVKCNYATCNKPSDEDPPLWKRNMWLYRDFIRQGMSHLTGERRMPWRRLVSRLINAIKQHRISRI